MNQEVLGDTLPPTRDPSLDLSVVCPFYNEGRIIEDAIRGLLERLEAMDLSWELIVVDDGSTDESREIARKVAAGRENVRVLGYRFNRGRGHGLRTGLAQARGRIIVTTEIDLSWGEDIVERLHDAMLANPDTDIVVASPHLPGGGYRNVPAKRVFFSRFGNWVIRACMSNAVSMNTGMTRAYRREVVQSLPLEEDRKEFHLEVVLKAQALNCRFAEIPAVLEWKEYKLQGQRVERKSSSKVNKLVVTHSLFSLFANPIRYVWGLSAGALTASLGFLVAGVIRYAMGLVSVYMLIVSLALAIIAIILFGFGVIAQQGNMVQREVWAMKQALRRDQLERRPGTSDLASEAGESR
jgi:dolichol-phosphate mannosyltransferase